MTDVSDSILDSTKKALGLDAAYDVFDLEIIMFINGVLSTLNQLGSGPTNGFSIADDTATWDDFLGEDPKLNNIKTYVFLRVKLLFDPPSTSYAIEALDKQRLELEWRINVQREGDAWVDPEAA